MKTCDVKARRGWRKRRPRRTTLDGLLLRSISDVRFVFWFVTSKVDIIVGNKNTCARFSYLFKDRAPLRFAVHSFVFRTKIVLHLFKKTLFQDR